MGNRLEGEDRPGQRGKGRRRGTGKAGCVDAGYEWLGLTTAGLPVHTPAMGRSMTRVEDLVAEAVRLGADALEFEYRGGQENVAAMRGCTGVGIARMPSGSPEAATLRSELQSLIRRKTRLSIGTVQCDVVVRAYESFGGRAYRLYIRRLRTITRPGPASP